MRARIPMKVELECPEVEKKSTSPMDLERHSSSNTRRLRDLLDKLNHA